MSIPYCICTEISQTSYIQGNKGGYRENTKKIADQMSLKEYIDPFTGSENKKA